MQYKMYLITDILLFQVLPNIEFPASYLSQTLLLVMDGARRTASPRRPEDHLETALTVQEGTADLLSIRSIWTFDTHRSLLCPT